MAVMKYRNPANPAEFLELPTGMAESAADAKYEPIGSTAAHAAAADPHPVYATDTDVAGKVAKTGDAMTGALTVLAPSADMHASTKKYVDDKVAAIPAPPAGFTRTILDVTTTYTALAVANTDYVYNCKSAAAFTLTMPTTAGNKNRYTIKRATTTTANITVAAAAGQTIDGSASFVLDASGMSIDLISDLGTNWMVV